jgi:hypothetical protein
MLVICNSISGKDVPLEQRVNGEGSDVNYSPLIIGEIYTVYGILFFKNRIEYLVDSHDDRPNWVPSCLFSVIDSSLTSNYFSAVITKESEFSWLYENGAQFIIGYQEIIESSEHFIGLIERNETDLITFFENKKLFLTSLECMNKVVLTQDLPEHNLSKGTKGLIIDVYKNDGNLSYEVEFTDESEQVLAQLEVKKDYLKKVN